MCHSREMNSTIRLSGFHMVIYNGCVPGWNCVDFTQTVGYQRVPDNAFGFLVGFKRISTYVSRHCGQERSRGPPQFSERTYPHFGVYAPKALSGVLVSITPEAAPRMALFGVLRRSSRDSGRSINMDPMYKSSDGIHHTIYPRASSLTRVMRYFWRSQVAFSRNPS